MGQQLRSNGYKRSNGLSDEIAKELKAYGFKYLGTVIVYSHLQACGVINDHAQECPPVISGSTK